VANPLNRYLVNSPMLPDLKRDPDGGLTLYIQYDAPGKDRESNWLSAPKGHMIIMIRLIGRKPRRSKATTNAKEIERMAPWIEVRFPAKVSGDRSCLLETDT